MIYFVGKPVNFPDIENCSLEFMLNYFQDKSEIGFDTETTGFDAYLDKILTYQLGNGVHQFVIDNSMYPITLISDLLCDKELIIHNAKFDLKFLFHLNIYPTKIWDTYLGEAVIYKGNKEVRKALGIVVERYFNAHLNKEIRGKIFREGLTERVIKYAAEDTKYLLDLKEAQYRKLSSLDLLNSIELENTFVSVLTYAEYCGFYFDKNTWKKKITQDLEDRNKAIERLNSWVIEQNLTKFINTQLDLFSTDKQVNINWDSPKQVAPFLQSLGVNTKIVDEKTGELKDSIEANVLEKQKNVTPFISLYIEYKKLEKIISTYGESFLSKVHPVTGRIHTSFTQIMDTGRLSSGGRNGNIETINLQNIPRIPENRVEGKVYERDCFIAENGNILIDADYSGQEQIVFANWCLDKDIISFYEKKLGDMHSYIASKIFPELKDLSLNDIKKYHKTKRQIAKSAGFAINYGGDGSTIADNLNLSLEEGNAIYNAYFTAFPGVGEYFKKTAKQALRDGYILFNTISKSKCFINFFDKYIYYERKINQPGFWEVYREEKLKESPIYLNELKPLVSKYFQLKGKICRLSYNYPVQGSSAEITKLAGIYLFRYILTNKLQNIVKIVNIVHDELVVECPESMSSTVKVIVENCMQRAGDLYCKVVPLKAEATVGKFWNH